MYSVDNLNSKIELKIYKHHKFSFLYLSMELLLKLTFFTGRAFVLSLSLTYMPYISDFICPFLIVIGFMCFPLLFICLGMFFKNRGL